jgi:hypothetical protein
VKELTFPRGGVAGAAGVAHASARNFRIARSVPVNFPPVDRHGSAPSFMQAHQGQAMRRVWWPSRQNPMRTGAALP